MLFCAILEKMCHDRSGTGAGKAHQGRKRKEPDPQQSGAARRLFVPERKQERNGGKEHTEGEDYLPEQTGFASGDD